MVPLRSALLPSLIALLWLVPVAHADRPTDPGTGVYGLPNYTVEEEPPHCTGDVCLHWVATGDQAPPNLEDGPDADTVPDAIEILGFGLERAHDHMTGVLGWKPPMPDGQLGGGTDITDVYLSPLDGRAAGVAVRDDDPADHLRPHGYAIIDSAYLAPALLGWSQRKLGPHELQHLIEYSYDGWFESWNGESTAEWSAAQSDGTYELLFTHTQTWAQLTEAPLLGVRDPKTHSPPQKAYASVVWQRWLENRYGNELIRGIWQRGDLANPLSFVPASFDAEQAGETTFYEEFVAFSAANAEWRAASSGLDWGGSQPDVERAGTLTPGAEGDSEARLDHTTFRLFDVPVTDAATYELRAGAPAGTRSAVALVGRRGDAEGGTLETVVQPLPTGGQARIGLADPSRFERITAVLINADVSLLDPAKDDNGWDWRFARDDQRFTARVVKTDRPPPDPVAPVEPPRSGQPEVDQPLPPPLGPIAEDLFPPVLRVASLPRDALDRLRAGRPVRVGLLVDEPTALSAEVAVGRARTVLVRATTKPGPRGRRVVVLRASRSARRRLARVSRATLTVAARDAAGNAATARRSLRARSPLAG